MNTKYEGHTPGPWTVGGELISRAGTATEIASVWDRHEARRDAPLPEEANANRRLIADAPMLLKQREMLAYMLSRTLAALETPRDLTAIERQEVIEDAGAYLDFLENGGE